MWIDCIVIVLCESTTCWCELTTSSSWYIYSQPHLLALLQRQQSTALTLEKCILHMHFIWHVAHTLYVIYDIYLLCYILHAPFVLHITYTIHITCTFCIIYYIYYTHYVIRHYIWGIACSIFIMCNVSSCQWSSEGSWCCLQGVITQEKEEEEVFLAY